LSREDLINFEGVVTEVLAGGIFNIMLDNEQPIQARLSGRMRKFHIRVILGDRVTVGLSPYDPSHGLIVHRHKTPGAPPPKFKTKRN